MSNQVNNDNSKVMSTLIGGLLLGGMTLGMSQSAIATLGGSTVGSSVGAIIATVLNRKKSAEDENQLAILNQSIHTLKTELEVNQDHINLQIATLNDTINNFKTEVPPSEIVPGQEQIVIKIDDLGKLINNVNTDITELKTKLEQINIPKSSGNYPTPKVIKTGITGYINKETKTEISDNPVIKWMEERGVNFKGYNQDQTLVAMNEENEKIGIYLGENYTILATLYRTIKRNIYQKIIKNDPTPKPYKIYLPEQEEEIKIWQEFCQMLNQSSFLSRLPLFDKRDEEGKRYITVDVMYNQEHYEFLKGLWFEPYVYQTMGNLIKNQSGKLDKDRNINIEFNVTDNSVLRGELDMLFLVNNEPLWIECKTGIPYDKYSFLGKYTQIGQKLSIPKQRAFLVVWEMSDHQAENLTSRWGITVVNRNNFIEKITAALKENLPANNQEYQKIEMPKKINLNPLERLKEIYCYSTEYRLDILTNFIKIFATVKESVILDDIKKQLLMQMPQVEDLHIYQVLKAVWKAGCVENKEGRIIRAFRDPVNHLKYDDVDILEQKCIAEYTRCVLINDEHFFDDIEHIAEFEKIIGGKLPDELAIQEILKTIKR